MKILKPIRNSADPYEMDIDVFENDEKIPALSEKNIKFTKGILNYDSNYNKESDKNAGPYSKNIFSRGFKVKEKNIQDRLPIGLLK